MTRSTVTVTPCLNPFCFRNAFFSPQFAITKVFQTSFSPPSSPFVITLIAAWRIALGIWEGQTIKESRLYSFLVAISLTRWRNIHNCTGRPQRWNGVFHQRFWKNTIQYSKALSQRQSHTHMYVYKSPVHIYICARAFFQVPFSHTKTENWCTTWYRFWLDSHCLCDRYFKWLSYNRLRHRILCLLYSFQELWPLAVINEKWISILRTDIPHYIS